MWPRVAQDEDGSTALHNAARTNRLEVARLLLEFGADRAAKNEYGETARDAARDLAVQNDHTAMAALLQ